MDYSSVPTSAFFDNCTRTKYTINQPPTGKIVLSKLACLFLVMGAIALAVISALAVFIFVPGCIEASPQALTKSEDMQSIMRHEKEEINSRLPRHLSPTHYRLHIMPFLQEGNFTSYGFISIDVHVKESTDKVVLNLNDIVVDKQSIRVKHSKEEVFLRIVDHGYDNEKQFFTIQLDRKMKLGQNYKVEMKFIGQLNDLNQGFYRSKYVDGATGQTRWMASTQFSPTDARRAFPCFDEPDFKATFTISVGRPTNMTSLSNTLKRDTTNSTEMPGWVWDNYEETPPMSSYLVAFIVSDLQPYEFNTDGRLYSIWARKDAINQAVYSSDIAPKLLKYYEGYFNIKYPLPKMDIVAVPDFGYSAMENWGLITFREKVLLLDTQVVTIDDYRDATTIMAHELTHQWFGNLITPQWWDDLWLKEGFASYFNYKGVEHIKPQWNISNEYIYSDLNSAFAIDSLESIRPLSFKVQNSNQIRQAFDPISYSKGSSIIRMMHHFLGEETFKAALIHFLNDHQYANANHDNLFKALTDKAHTIGVLEPNVTVKDIMDTWVLQPGFPLVTAVAENDNTVRVSQRRFLKSGIEAEEELTWWVPISHATKSSPNFDDTKAKAWIRNENETVINIDTNSWWLLNLHHTGYYIVNYDETNWKNLLQHLMEFPPVIRAQLLSNSMDLAAANLLDYDIPLKITLRIGHRDTQLVPYLIAFSKIEYVYNMLMTTPLFTQFDIFILAAFKNAFDNTGFNENPSDSYATQKMRRAILQWACKRPDSRCVIESMHAYRAWMTTHQPIAANLREIVYCTAIREGGEIEWNFAYQQYLTTNLPSEKVTILAAMGCSSKPWILTRYLGFMLTPESGVRKQDGVAVFTSVANNIVGHSLAFDFLRSNWKDLNDYYGSAFSRVAKMVTALTTYMNTPYQVEQLESFRDSNELGTTKQAFETAIDTVRGNIRWMTNSYKSIEEWLYNHRQHFGM